MITMTAHAVTRAAQRNLSPEDIDYVLEHGKKIRRGGACFFYLGEKDIKPEDQGEDDIARLEGTILVLDPKMQAILTVYRNREKGLKEIRKKQPYFAIAA